eukprot:365953-Chlamydomonas_euryale.AAC.4
MPWNDLQNLWQICLSRQGGWVFQRVLTKSATFEGEAEAAALDLSVGANESLLQVRPSHLCLSRAFEGSSHLPAATTVHTMVRAGG